MQFTLLIMVIRCRCANSEGGMQLDLAAWCRSVNNQPARQTALGAPGLGGAGLEAADGVGHPWEAEWVDSKGFGVICDHQTPLVGDGVARL